MASDFSNKDFKDFINSPTQLPPESLNRHIQGLVKKDLNPDFKVVFFKLFSIQAFIGILTMLFCPQFEMSLTNQDQLFHYFHHTFGVYGCFAVCGVLFIGTGAIFASHLLNINEVRKVRSHRILYYFSLTGLAVSFFLFLGAQVYFEMLAAWMFGAIVGGVSLFEFNCVLRDKFWL
jgi:hypothetical protein